MEEGRLIDHWLGRENSLRDLFKLLGGDVAKLDNGITVADLDTTWEDLRRLAVSIAPVDSTENQINAILAKVIECYHWLINTGGGSNRQHQLIDAIVRKFATDSILGLELRKIVKMDAVNAQSRYGWGTFVPCSYIDEDNVRCVKGSLYSKASASNHGIAGRCCAHGGGAKCHIPSCRSGAASRGTEGYCKAHGGGKHKHGE
jgi:hypothetical protein